MELLARIPTHGRKCILEPGITNGPLPRDARNGVRCLPPHLELPFFRGSARLARSGTRVLTILRSVSGESSVHPTFYRDLHRAPRCPKVVTVYDMILERYFPDCRDAVVKSRCIRSADVVIAISHSTRTELLDLFDLPEERVFVVHLGVELNPPTFQVLPEIARRPFVLWVGNRAGYKNFLRSAEALATYDKAGELWLLCAGGGPFTRCERAKLVEVGLANQTLQRDLSEAQLAWAYGTAQALMYTSECEGFGLPILEAMAQGCPVVTSDTSSMPEVGGEAAIYVDPASTESIAFGLENAIREGRETTAVLRRRSRAEAFSWDRCAQRTHEVYSLLD
ncbi:MAG: glycosyltransferase family 1 protein [Acidobacteriota bacterium]